MKLRTLLADSRTGRRSDRGSGPNSESKYVGVTADAPISPAAARRAVVVNYCVNCHSAQYMRYNRLKDLNLSRTRSSRT